MLEQPSAAPQSYNTVSPWVVTEDTGAFLDFVSQAFDGEELGRVATEDGLIGHGEIRVGDTVVLAFDRHADWAAMPSLLRVFGRRRGGSRFPRSRCRRADRHSDLRRCLRAARRTNQGSLRQYLVGELSRRGRHRRPDVGAAAGSCVFRKNAGCPGHTRCRTQRPTSGPQQCAGSHRLQLTSPSTSSARPDPNPPEGFDCRGNGDLLPREKRDEAHASSHRNQDHDVKIRRYEHLSPRADANIHRQVTSQITDRTR